jgi:hypothetical protein
MSYENQIKEKGWLRTCEYKSSKAMNPSRIKRAAVKYKLFGVLSLTSGDCMK